MNITYTNGGKQHLGRFFKAAGGVVHFRAETDQRI